MQHRETTKRGQAGSVLGAKRKLADKTESRYTVALPRPIAIQVEQYAEAVDMSVSKAIASLVRLGLESQENRKREFFRKLKQNLANDDPNQEDRLVDEFRALVLGR
jgi:hypothetical protein